MRSPTLSVALAKLQPVQIVGGARSTFVVSQDGKVYAAGDRTGGCLGVGVSSSHVSVPTPVSALSHYVVKKVATHSCCRHTLALTADGKLFSWGDGSSGQLGHGNTASHDRPKMVECLLGKHMHDMACGSGYCAAVASNGELYTWGNGCHGRLGHGNTEMQTKPKLVSNLNWDLDLELGTCSQQPAFSLMCVLLYTSEASLSCLASQCK